MSKDISKMRENYKMGLLLESEISGDPMELFEKWLAEAINSEALEANAMNLATLSDQGQPTSRTVLLKEVVNGGFVFYTNYESKKAQDLKTNPLAALNFLWLELQRQVRIEGSVSKVSRSQSEAYFHSRPYGSQVGAITSKQSRVVRDREELEKRYADNYKKYEADGKVPMPENWGGYILIPDFVEFWQGRESRLHDRITFSLEGEKWQVRRLEP